jgi:hypothetical protein
MVPKLGLAVMCGQYGLALDARRFSLALNTGKGDGVRRKADGGGAATKNERRGIGTIRGPGRAGAETGAPDDSRIYALQRGLANAH